MVKYKKIIIISAAVVAVGTLLGYTTKVSVYIEAPKNIEANAEDIYDIQGYINEQRIANKLMQKMQQQQYQKTIYRQETPKYEPPPTEDCWDYANDGYQYPVDCFTWEWK